MGSLNSMEIFCPGTRGIGTAKRMPFSLRSAHLPGIILVVPFHRAITRMGISAGNLKKALVSARAIEVSCSVGIGFPLRPAV